MSAESERLKKEIDKAYKAVSNKINRTERTKGAKVGGSEFDPRRDPSAHNRMRSPERMREYLGELKTFMNRSNQFVAGQGGAPLRAGYFNKIYKPTERRLDDLQNRRDDNLSGVKSPTGFAIKDLATALPKAGGHGRFGPYKRFDREASDIASQSAMEKLTAQLKDQMRPEYLGEKLSEERERLQKVLDYLGDSERASEIGDNLSLEVKVHQMDDDAFDLFWFGTNVASGIFLFYELEKERNEGNFKERRQDRVIEQKFHEAIPAADWAIDESEKRKATREAGVAQQQANLKTQRNDFRVDRRQRKGK
jgi:hypothetical protein